MKKQLNPNIKAHLLRSAFYVLLLLGVCAIPFALAQRNSSKQAAAISTAGLQPTAPSQLLPNDAQPVPSLPRTSQTAMLRSATQTYGSALSKQLLPRVLRPAATYELDDGTAEDAIGLTLGGDIISLNEFAVIPGSETIVSVEIAWGTPVFPDPSLNGLPYTVAVWSDPNGDGNPTDAVLLTTAAGVVSQQGTNTFITTNITPTTITTPNFFVGFLINHVGGQFPSAFDQDAPLFNRSYVAGDSVQGNIMNLNDNEIPVAPIESFGLLGNWLIRANAGGGGTPTPTPSPTCTPIVVTGDISLGDPTQIDRLFRSGIPQTCPPSTFCAIFGDPTPRHYDSHSFTNTTGATQCVNINTDTPCTGTNFVFTGAYLGSFDPNNICTNWIGDSGSSPNPAQAFDVEVPAGETLVVVVSEVTANAGCSSYTVTVSGICPEPTPTPTPGAIRLRFGAHERAGTKVVQLKYIGATSPTVDVFRNGALLATAQNDGTYVDVLTERGIFTYQVCEAGTTNCSNEVEVRFRGP